MGNDFAQLLERLVERVHPHPLPLVALQPPQVPLSGWNPGPSLFAAPRRPRRPAQVGLLPFSTGDAHAAAAAAADSALTLGVGAAAFAAIFSLTRSPLGRVLGAWRDGRKLGLHVDLLVLHGGSPSPVPPHQSCAAHPGGWSKGRASCRNFSWTYSLLHLETLCISLSLTESSSPKGISQLTNSSRFPISLSGKSFHNWIGSKPISEQAVSPRRPTSAGWPQWRLEGTQPSLTCPRAASVLWRSTGPAKAYLFRRPHPLSNLWPTCLPRTDTSFSHCDVGDNTLLHCPSLARRTFEEVLS